MTNNDKAIADIKRAKDFIVSYGISGDLSDDVPSIEIAKVEMTLRELIDQALTPQSSADLSAPIEKIEGPYTVDDNGDYEWVVDPETGEGMSPQKICDLLNAQGRTQSAPEGYALLPLEWPEDKHREISYALGLPAPANQYEALVKIFTATPPVTAPIEKVDGLSEALADHDCASDAILGKNIDILAKAARLQLQRQGD